MDHSFVILEIRKCNDPLLKNEDIECRSSNEIDKWLSNKKINFRVIQNLMNFEEYNKEDTKR